MKIAGLVAFVLLCFLHSRAVHADTFGSEANAFTIDFVDIGNAGNGDDDGAGGGLYSSPYGGVDYAYRLGVTEVPQDWITKAMNLGMTNITAGAWTGSRPAAYMTWYECVAFMNWLNTNTGHQPAYNLTYSGDWSMNLWGSEQAWQLGGQNLYRHKDAYYFLPGEDEWYKAAYHQNDGATANYWDYATGSNTPPTPGGGTAAGRAWYNGIDSFPTLVENVGGASSYGTRGQNGNVWEWNESALDGANDSPTEVRGLRGGAWGNTEFYLHPSYRGPPSNRSTRTITSDSASQVSLSRCSATTTTTASSTRPTMYYGATMDLCRTMRRPAYSPAITTFGEPTSAKPPAVARLPVRMPPFRNRRPYCC